jgi:hypothetical protein
MVAVRRLPLRGALLDRAVGDAAAIRNSRTSLICSYVKTLPLNAPHRLVADTCQHSRVRAQPRASLQKPEITFDIPVIQTRPQSRAPMSERARGKIVSVSPMIRPWTSGMYLNQAGKL